MNEIAGARMGNRAGMNEERHPRQRRTHKGINNAR